MHHCREVDMSKLGDMANKASDAVRRSYEDGRH